MAIKMESLGEMAGGCSSVVEHELPKLGVEGSIPFTRSSFGQIHPVFAPMMIGGLMSLTIWHNPRCSKSRQTLAILEEKGLTPEVRLYQEDTPSEEEIRGVLTMLDIEPRALMRTGEAEYKEQGLKTAGDDALVAAMVNTPKLIERPVVINGDKAALGRPPENVLDII